MNLEPGQRWTRDGVERVISDINPKLVEYTKRTDLHDTPFRICKIKTFKAWARKAKMENPK